MKRIPGVISVLLVMLTFSLSAQAQNRARIKAVKPAQVYPGDTFDIVGYGFGDRQGNNRTVMIYMNEFGYYARFKLRVLKWSDTRIRLQMPDTASPGHYIAAIYFGDETELVTNEVSLTVRGGIVIRDIDPNPASPGETIDIHGIRFGRSQGIRFVSINRNGQKRRLPILDWSDNLIRAQIPDRIISGRYLLLIYYNNSRTTSSDSVEITVGRRRE